jgi:hypothetical protein
MASLVRVNAAARRFTVPASVLCFPELDRRAWTGGSAGSRAPWTLNSLLRDGISSSFAPRRTRSAVSVAHEQRGGGPRRVIGFRRRARAGDTTCLSAGTV